MVLSFLDGIERYCFRDPHSRYALVLCGSRFDFLLPGDRGIQKVEVTEMKIKAILPYYGGKRTLAPQIVEMLGRHSAYWEPFCGSIAVLLAKPPCQMETINDLHSDLINLARVIQNRETGLQLYDKLNRTLFHEQMFLDAKAKWSFLSEKAITENPDPERAYLFMVISWFGINGVAGTKRYDYQFAVRWCVGGGQGGRRWRSVKESIPAWHKRLNEVVIINRDAFKLLENIRDEQGTVIYCDPPYIKKSNRYLHDLEEGDHECLAALLKRFTKVRIIVSYYDHPMLAQLNQGWEKIDVAFNNQAHRNADRDNN